MLIALLRSIVSHLLDFSILGIPRVHTLSSRITAERKNQREELTNNRLSESPITVQVIGSNLETVYLFQTDDVWPIHGVHHPLYHRGIRKDVPAFFQVKCPSPPRLGLREENKIRRNGARVDFTSYPTVSKLLVLKRWHVREP